jgi:hypothetical protein
MKIKENNYPFPESFNGASSVPRRDQILTGQATIPTESVGLKMAV